MLTAHFCKPSLPSFPRLSLTVSLARYFYPGITFISISPVFLAQGWAPPDTWTIAMMDLAMWFGKSRVDENGKLVNGDLL